MITSDSTKTIGESKNRTQDLLFLRAKTKPLSLPKDHITWGIDYRLTCELEIFKDIWLSIELARFILSKSTYI